MDCQTFLFRFCTHSNVAQDSPRDNYQSLKKGFFIGCKMRGSKLGKCLEYKRDSTQRDRMESIRQQIEQDIGHSVIWQPYGSEGGRSPILALYFDDKPDSEDDEVEWAIRYYQTFRNAVERLMA